jgi:SAM-dependent methyltransferase
MPFPELVIILVLLIILVTALIASAAPWLPTKHGDYERIFKLAEIKPGEVFYDLGCGDGRLVAMASRAGASAVGFDLSLLPYFLAQLRLRREKVKAKILFKNFFKQDLSEADIIYIFLTPPVMPKMRSKLVANLKKGTRIISYAFAVPDLVLIKKDTAPGRPNIYLYKI